MADFVEPGDTGESASISKTKRKQLTWPDPLVVDPTATHTHTIILLHGRGSNSERFGVDLLNSKTSRGETLTGCFPGAKFIFPTAKKRRATIFKRMPINQWFDNWSLDDPSERQHLQYDGIRETSAFVHDLIQKEARLVGLSHVVIGGLSQGCAAALHVLLNFKPTGDSERAHTALAGFVGMSGWLPFADSLDPRSRDGRKDDGEDEEENDDFFGSDDEGDDDQKDNECDEPAQETSLEHLQLRAANTARDIASLPPLPDSPEDSLAFPRTPIFLGHGRHDEKVSVKLGCQTKEVLEALGCAVQWKDYDEGHWYKVPDEIDDIVHFLRGLPGFESTASEA
ncbi:Alpha/Beta hydrolase protein [Phyllosticta capitalensis]|uniref:Acyl-protein thioesterase 1 n=1 Tax=Phyllosticta capitalensis TaxID=121624 RepID=A0ABR1YIL6_9PEZI